MYSARQYSHTETEIMNLNSNKSQIQGHKLTQCLLTLKWQKVWVIIF